MTTEPTLTKGELRQRMKGNRQKSMDISRQCRSYMNTKHKAYQMLNELKEEADYRRENFEYVQTSLKDLEGIHKMVLPSMFEVSHQNYNEQQEA